VPPLPAPRQVIPVAEEAGVYLACHPDDPPLPRLRGLARIMSTPEDLLALLSYHPSPHNGLTLCQGCVSEMCGGTGRGVPDIVRTLPPGRVHFVHFRDVVGCAGSFVETFQVGGCAGKGGGGGGEVSF
jgi:mannonate dehydratase